jgi:Pin2-interacting protein X1
MWISTQRKEKTSGSRHGEKFWEEEKHSFGARMMNKMGWEQGKGLGKEGTGMNSYIQARKKNDSLGIGATHTQADEQFKASQSIYNDLLSRLSVAADGDGGIQPEDKSTVNTGLLMKQKMESRRLYSRFARARDVSNYSAEAMREILGKTKETEPKLQPTPLETKEEDDMNELITTSKVSMNDYFTQKLGQLTKRLDTRQSFSESDQVSTYTDVHLRY